MGKECPPLMSIYALEWRCQCNCTQQHDKPCDAEYGNDGPGMLQSKLPPGWKTFELDNGDTKHLCPRCASECGGLEVTDAFDRRVDRTL